MKAQKTKGKGRTNGKESKREGDTASTEIGKSSSMVPSLHFGASLLGAGVACLFATTRFFPFGSGWSEDSLAGMEELDDLYMTGDKPSVDPSALSNSWWRKKDVIRFKSEHVLPISTANFNATVTDPSRPLMIIAFYDPRSEAFRVLRSYLDQIADSLAMEKSAGTPIADFGASDVTVHSWLAMDQAPEMRTGWQQAEAQVKKGFRFGKSRHFPIILVIYQDGYRMGEYTDVVDVKHVTRTLRLFRLRKGGMNLTNVKQLHDMLRGPGPLALSCGVSEGSEEHKAFNTTAHLLHGEFAPCILPLKVCADALSLNLTNFTGPQVIWTRGEGQALTGKALTGQAPTASGSIRFANSSIMQNATLLQTWLQSHTREVLEEMTPDNSHTFLENVHPLAIFLVDAKDKAARNKIWPIVESLEQELKEDFSMVWSDCKSFASQFKAKNECPVVAVVDSETLDYEKKRIKDIESSSIEAAAASLKLWMRKTKAFKIFAQSRKEEMELEKERQQADNASHGNASRVKSTRSDASNSPPNSKKKKRSSTNQNEEEEKFDGTATYQDDLVATRDDWHSKVMGGFTPYNGSHLETSFELYHSLLNGLLLLRNSYGAKYSHLKFDFSDIDRAQKLHHSLRQLVQNEESLEPIIRNKTRLRHLWAAIERRVAFTVRMTNLTSSSAISKLFVKIVNGITKLADVYQRLFSFLHSHARRGTLGVPKVRPRELERRDVSEMSVKEFLESYAKPGRPVIITGLNLTEEEPWTLDFFKRKCNTTVALHKLGDNTVTWGGLKDVEEPLTLPEFIDTFQTNATRRSWYVHDWSLPSYCADVFGPAPYRGFTVPKYFAGDYFQRTAFDGYQHTWPSLFIGSNETLSKMHIDSGGTNFWLHLLSGRKEWRFYNRQDLINVYKSVRHEHFWLDVFKPDPVKYPLIEYAEMHTGIQEPGELIFIPGGNPHGVRNLEPIHGISMNYVDASNIGVHLWHMLAGDKYNSVEMFTDGYTIPHGMRSDQGPLRFGEWKSVDWHSLTYDL